MLQIETFEQTEVGDGGSTELAADPEAIAIIERLDLVGQRSLMDPDTRARCPYRQMNAIERRVYQTLYPEHTPIESYRNGMIPLRVLQIAAHAKDIFGDVEVWSEATAQTDPVLVGLRKNPLTWLDPEAFILARWGEALQPFPVLLEKAREAIAQRLETRARKARAEADRVLAEPRAFATGILNGEAEPAFGL